MQEHTLDDCYCRWDVRRLVIGNDRIERVYHRSGGMLRAEGLLDRRLKRQWLPPGPGRVLFRLPGMQEGDAFQALEVECGIGDNHGLSEPFLWVSLRMSFPRCVVETRLGIHPGVAAVSMAHGVSGQPGERDWAEVPGRDFRACRREAQQMKESEWPRPDTIEALSLPGGHLKARAVRFFDVTDIYNTLARKEECLLYGGQGYEKLQGNLLSLEDAVEPGGLFVVKESPTLVGQLNYAGYDFHTAGREVLEVRGTGLAPAELEPERALPCYGSTVGVFDSRTENGEETLRAWYNAQDRRIPGRHYILANTWGGVAGGFAAMEISRVADPFLRCRMAGETKTVTSKPSAQGRPILAGGPPLPRRPRFPAPLSSFSSSVWPGFPRGILAVGLAEAFPPTSSGRRPRAACRADRAACRPIREDSLAC